MHFSKLLFTAAATLAAGPASVYGYGLAGAALRFYDSCDKGEIPGSKPLESSPMILHENKCERLHSEYPPDGFGFYAVNGWLFNGHQDRHCHHISAYTNDNCEGEPAFKVHFWRPDNFARGTCHTKHIGLVSLKLECYGKSEMEHHQVHEDADHDGHFWRA
ncbi:hypothetical protein VTN00DRAFT_9353 [Thermoascus crustaceus]|uniref:uncharacterized protein n=1 Tax=Thermoascus crustaceus TaxID=5088 RepID=UPI003743EC44